MNPCSVRPLQTSGDTKKFIRLLWDIYRDDPYWVPPLMMDRKKLMDRKKNPFYWHSDAEFFLAEFNGKVVGRIGAIVNHNHNREHRENIGFFGFFESINDQSIANALFDAACNYLRSKGVTAVRGPANPSVNDEYGLLVEGFDSSPVILMTYNPPFYIDLIKNYGFSVCKNLYAYRLSQDSVYTDRLIRFNDLVRQREKLTFRSVDMKHFDEEVARIKNIYNKAWAPNWGAVPMTDAEFDALAADLKMIIVPELVILAESRGETIGFALTLPDINVALKHNRNGGTIGGLYHLLTKKRKIKSARIVVLGIVPEHVRTGAAGVLFYETAIRAKKLGYLYGEASWVLEDNVMMNRAAEMMDAKRYKTYQLFQMNL